MGAERELIRTLTLPYESIKTLYQGDSEVRLYRNELIGQHQVGKRYDTLGLESTVAVNEGQLLKQITHDHVVPVLDVVIPSGYPAPLAPVELIMPFYERGSLADAFLAGERFSVGEAIAMIVGALLGLAEIHECYGVLHRDLKSPNLFLTKEGRLLIGDLGVSITMDGKGGGEALPSPRLYCPPETFTTHRADRPSDLFQMGIVLHELSSGPLPYDDPAYATEKMAERLGAGRPAVRPKHMRPHPGFLLAFAGSSPRRRRPIPPSATPAPNTWETPSLPCATSIGARSSRSPIAAAGRASPCGGLIADSRSTPNAAGKDGP